MNLLKLSKSLWSHNPIPGGTALYLPLWNPGLSGPIFKSIDPYGHECVVSGPLLKSKGRLFNGTDDIITIPAHSSLLLGSGDFTITSIIYKTGLTNGEYLMGTASGVIDIFLSGTGGAIKIDLEGASTVTSNAGLIDVDVLVHVDIVGSGDDCIIYKDGGLFQTVSNGFAGGNNTTSEDIILGFNA